MQALLICTDLVMGQAEIHMPAFWIRTKDRRKVSCTFSLLKLSLPTFDYSTLLTLRKGLKKGQSMEYDIQWSS